MGTYIIEGTWEEIERRKAELVGQHLRLTVNPPKATKHAAKPAAEPVRQAKVLRGLGMFAGRISTERYLEEKHAELLEEDRKLK